MEKTKEMPLKIFHYLLTKEPLTIVGHVGLSSVSAYSLEDANASVNKTVLEPNKLHGALIGYELADDFVTKLQLPITTILPTVEKEPEPKLASFDAMAAYLRDNGYRVTKLKKISND